jgi:hypothetical protein
VPAMAARGRSSCCSAARPDMPLTCGQQRPRTWRRADGQSHH